MSCCILLRYVMRYIIKICHHTYLFFSSNPVGQVRPPSLRRRCLHVQYLFCRRGCQLVQPFDFTVLCRGNDFQCVEYFFAGNGLNIRTWIRSCTFAGRWRMCTRFIRLIWLCCCHSGQWVLDAVIRLWWRGCRWCRISFILRRYSWFICKQVGVVS